MGEARSKEIGHKREKPGNEGWSGDSYSGWERGAGSGETTPPKARLWPEGPGKGDKATSMQTGPLGPGRMEFQRALSTVMFASAVSFKAA